jgi:hypothetical protein
VLTQFDLGFLVGLLIGEGHFGGDGRHPHVTLRMHVRHEAIFRWLERAFPDGRLYGPYDHGGRHYFQWMARGAFLRDELVPILDQYLSADIDRHSFGRYQLMKERYAQQLSSGLAVCDESVAAQPESPGLLTPGEPSGTYVSAPQPGTSVQPANQVAPPRSARSGRPDGDEVTLDELFASLRDAWSD